MKKKISVTYFITELSDEYEFKCAQAGTALNHAVDDALRTIRNRLKYGEDVTDKETQILEEIRGILAEFYVEG